MISKKLKQIFKQGSTTYFTSSLFFSNTIKEDVFALYGFVRTADNFIDSQVQDSEGFNLFEATYRDGISKGISKDDVIGPFVKLQYKRSFQQQWIDDFLSSMRMDLTTHSYETLDQTIDYMRGSAEAIGLMMAKILDLPEQSYQAAAIQGKAMQYINFIRDIKEDRDVLHRQYIPKSLYQEHGLSDLSDGEITSHQEAFSTLIRSEIDRYRSWQQEADTGYQFIPKRSRIPIRTASDMYAWTANKIYGNPNIVLSRQIKPRSSKIIFHAIKLLLST